MGLAYRGSAILDQNGVAIAGQRVTGMAGAGSRVYHRRAEWVRMSNFSAIRNAASAAVDSTGADLIVVGVGSQQSPLTGTFTDSRGNIWRQATASGLSVILFACPANVGPDHTFQVVGGTQIVFQGMLWAGARQDGLTVVGGVGQGTAGATSTFTPQQDNSLLFTNCISTGPGTFAAPTDYTLVSQIQGVTGDYRGGAIAFQIQPVRALAGVTWGGTATRSGATLAAFNPA